MAGRSAADVTVIVRSEQTTSERRISPAWTVAQFKTRLEPITGIPAGFQHLSLLVPATQAATPIECSDENTTQLSQWQIQPNVEIRVSDGRPPGARENYTNTSGVEHYVMPEDEYASRTDTVLAFKQKNRLGRFDPSAPSVQQEKLAHSYREIRERDISVHRRCRLISDQTDRRGSVRYVGLIPELPGVGAWVGIELDEPTGKNDGSANGIAYFNCRPNYGVFVKPDKVEVGDFPVLDDLADDDDDEF